MKVCLCGSTRFMDQFHQANVQLSLLGHIVYTVATSTKGEFKPTDDQKLMLDAVHLQKVHESDCVMVVGRQEDGTVYIGESTRREIMYATVCGKDVYLYEPDAEATGPMTDFSKVLTEAAETTVARDIRRGRREQRRREFMERITEGGIATVLADGHTGEPDCPACKAGDEEDEEKVN